MSQLPVLFRLLLLISKCFLSVWSGYIQFNIFSRISTIKHFDICVDHRKIKSFGPLTHLNRILFLSPRILGGGLGHELFLKFLYDGVRVLHASFDFFCRTVQIHHICLYRFRYSTLKPISIKTEDKVSI